MKYLINETLCEKVEMGGFDYYTLVDEINYPWYVITDNDKLIEVNKDNDDYYHQLNCSKVIATNNSSLDLPQVVNEVKELAKKANGYVVYSKDTKAIIFNEGYHVGYLKAKETYSFTKEDMVGFAEWYLIETTLSSHGKYFGFSNLDVFNIWNEQRIIKLNTK